MNQHRYRIVFNKVRGLLMAVAESAASRSKGDAPAERYGQSAPADSVRFDLRPSAIAAFLLLGGTLGFLPYAEAQIVADRSAPNNQQPTIFNAPNGVPLVNIQPPSAGGVSRNTYSQFDVQANGVILNNARSNVQTQLGGWVQGNPWLGNGSAKVILNEVNSSNPSLLKGYVELAGDRAQVVIANPSGITCDGCGFINANRATLTTGTPIINGGNLDGYRVQGGLITVQGAGLDASRSDTADLIARAVQVNAGIWANALNVITGPNQVAADLSQTTPIAGTGTAPAYALDVAALGGMYAGKIVLVGTEQGLGVRSAGQIGASIGDVAISLDGLLTNSGRITSATHTTVNASAGIINSGTIYAQGNTVLDTRGNVDNSSVIAAQGNTTVQANGPASRIASTSASIIASGLNADGSLATVGDLILSATDQAQLKGQTLAGGNAQIAANTLDLRSGTLAGNAITLTAHSGVIDATAATLQAQGTLSASASSRLITDAAKVSANQLTLSAHDLSNVGGEILQTGSGDTTIRLQGDLNNTAGRLATNSQNFTLAATTLTNADGKIEHAGTGRLDLSATTLDGIGGRIASNGLLALSAGKVTVNNGQITAQQLALDAGSLSNRGGRIVQTGMSDARVTITGTLDNTAGTLATNAPLTLTAGSVDNRGGTIQATGSATSLTVNVDGALDNSTQGQIGTDGNLVLSAQRLDNTAGRLTAGQSLAADLTQDLVNRNGLLAGRSGVTLAAASVDNRQGTLASVNERLILTSQGSVNNQGGTIEAAKTVQIDSTNLDNNAGKILGAALLIDTGSGTLDNTQGTLAANQGATLKSGRLNNDRGLIQSGADLDVDTQGGALTNTDGILLSQGKATLAIGDLDNRNGLLTGKASLTVSAQAITNTQAGILSSEGKLALTATGLDNQGGQVLTNGDATLNLGTGTLDNTGGLVHAGGQLTVGAGQVTNAQTSATTQGIEGQSVDLSASGLDNTQGNLRANDNLSLTIGQTFDNTNGHVTSLRHITVSGTSALTNTGGEFLAGQNLSLTIARLIGSGHLYALNDLTLTGLSDLSLSGQLIANHDTRVTATGTLTNSATIKAGNQLTLSATDLDNQTAGEIAAASTTVTATGTLTNRGLIDGQEVRLNAVTLNNRGTGRLYGDHLAIAADTLNNLAESSIAPVIAARARLDLGVGALNNRDNALIYSVGDLVLGRSLDGGGHATGQATTLTNSSATIEAGRDLILSVATLINQRSAFVYSSSAGTGYADYATLEWHPGGPWALFKAALVIPSSTTVTEDSGAARILAGRNIGIDGNVTNDKSDIMAGGSIVLDQARYTGISVQGQNGQTESGITVYCIVCANNQQPSAGLGKLRSVVTLAMLQKWATSGYDANDLYETPQIGTDPDTGQPIYGAPTSLLTYPIAHAFSPATVNPYSASNVVQNTVDLAPARLTANQAITGTATQITNLSIGGGVGQNATGTKVGTVTATSNRSLSPVSQVAALSSTGATGPNTVVRSGGVNLNMPGNSLYHLNPNPGGRYLIETDPRFADYRTWLGSDYMLNALAVDPATSQKRLGDGFYEQKLIREQVAELTGRRFLDGYQNDEAQYRALMDSGLTVAQAWNLRPGVALTVEQMAQLTSDIVWLVEQRVTLPDGTTTQALVPQVYVHVRPGDLSNDGALIAAEQINLNVTGDLLNQGRIAGRSVMALTADNIENLGGRLTGDAIGLSARNDLSNIGGEIAAGNLLSIEAGRDINVTSTLQTKEEVSGNLFQQTTSALDRLAGLYVTNPNGKLIVDAGRDVTLSGAKIDSAGMAQVEAGRDVSVGTLAETTTRTVDLGDNVEHRSQTGQEASRVETGSDLNLIAGQDLSVKGSALQSAGNLNAEAGNALMLETARLQESSDYRVQTAERDSHGSASSDRSQISTVQAEGNVSLKAGTTLGSEGARVEAGGDIALSGQTIALMARHDTEQSSGQIVDTGKGAQQGQYQTYRDTATGTVLSAGRDLTLESKGNTVIEGGALAAERKLDLKTGGDLSLLAAKSTNSEDRFDYKQSGRTATTLAFSEQEVRNLLTTITVGDGASLDVGGNFTASTGETRDDGTLNADRMTVDGVVKGDSRQQVSVSRTGEGSNANPENSQVLGNLEAQGIRNHSNDSFEPTAANATQTGQAALQQYLQSGLLQIKGDPEVANRLQQQLQADGSTLTFKDDSGKFSLTVAGQAKVQAVYNTLKLTETFDTQKFPDAQAAQIVTLVAAIVLTVCTGGAGGALGVALVGSAGTTALVVNAAIIAMSSTMLGQLAGGASFDKAFEAGVKAGATSALLAGVSVGVSEVVSGTPNGATTAIDSGNQTIQTSANAGASAASTGSSNLSALDKLGSTNYWQQTVLNAAAKGLVTQAEGGKFKDGALGSVLGSLSSSGAGIVGDQFSNTVANMAAHAVLGCAVAAASKQECGAGALGGAASAGLARLIDASLQDADLSETTRRAVIAGGAVGGSALLAKAMGKDALTAGNAAANEVLNNYLKHSEIVEKDARKNSECTSGDNACRQSIEREYAKISQQRDRALENCATPDSCRAARLEMERDMAELATRAKELEKLSYRRSLTTSEKKEAVQIGQNLNDAAKTYEQTWRQSRNVTPFNEWTTEEKNKTFSDAMTALGGLGAAGAVGRLPAGKSNVAENGGAKAGSEANTAEKAIAQAKVENNNYRDGAQFETNFPNGKATANLRLEYEQASRDLLSQSKRMLLEGKSEEFVANWATAQRNQLKIEYRELTPPDLLKTIEARNIREYGNPLGPSVEQLRLEGKSFRQIIEGAARPGGRDMDFSPPGFKGTTP